MIDLPLLREAILAGAFNPNDPSATTLNPIFGSRLETRIYVRGLDDDTVNSRLKWFDNLKLNNAKSRLVEVQAEVAALDIKTKENV